MKKLFGWFEGKMGLLRSLFSAQPQFEEKLKKATSNLGEIEGKKKLWDKECANNPWNEDDLYNVKSIIKENRKELNKLKNELKVIQKNEEAEVIKNRIENLKKIIDDDEKKFAKLNLRYKEYLESSGIKTAEAKTEKEKAEKQLEGYNIMSKYWRYLFLAVFGLSIIITIIIGVISSFIFGAKVWIIYSLLAFFIGLFMVMVITIISRGYTQVSEKEEWNIQFQGKILTIWESGWHIKFPFFMEISGKVFMGDNMLKLHMAENKDQAGKPSAKVDFVDSSAEIIVNIFYRVFDSYKAIYNIDNIERAVEEKMESGIRAYYGNQTIDEAIANRMEVDLRKIIIQNATEAEIFKSWGVKIISLAVTDIILPTEVEEARTKKLKADKEREVAEIKREQTRIEVETAELEGQSAGNRLKGMAKATGKTIEEIIALHLQEKRFEAWSKSGMLIVNNDSSETANSAIKGAAMAAGIKTDNKKNDEKGLKNEINTGKY